MATTVTTTTPDGKTTVATEPGPDLAAAFVADKQAFWGSFTRLVVMAAAGIVVLLIAMAVFLA